MSQGDLNKAARDARTTFVWRATLATGLSELILPCRECNKLPEPARATVDPFVKPCARFDIYGNWRPNPLKVLFIAEAPPGNSEGYFYDPSRHAGYKETLRKGLFGLLELTGSDTAAKLDHFKRRGYFLVDSVKCRCKKTNGQPPQEVTKTCARKWLGRELEEVGYPDRICILGRAASLALSQVPGFEDVSRYSVTKDCGKILETDTAKVLIWPFLGWRNEKDYAQKIPVFKEFCYVPPFDKLTTAVAEKPGSVGSPGEPQENLVRRE